MHNDFSQFIKRPLKHPRLLEIFWKVIPGSNYILRDLFSNYQNYDLRQKINQKIKIDRRHKIAAGLNFKIFLYTYFIILAIYVIM